MTQLTVVSKLQIEDDFAWTMRLCTEVQASREVLEMATMRFVRRSKGSFAERVRMASELSGIPRGVIEELVKDGNNTSR
jgi:hypothetical protein